MNKIEHFKELLFYVAELFEENNIIYWIDYGTLLGAVRSGEIIEWDSDIDIGVMGADVERICALKDQIVEDGYDFCAHQFAGPDPATVDDEIAPEAAHHIYVFYSKENRLSLEISVNDIVEGLCTRRWYGQYESAIGKEFSEEFIQPLDKVEMYGRLFPAPNNVKNFLEHRYGEGWRTPKR